MPAPTEKAIGGNDAKQQEVHTHSPRQTPWGNTADITHGWQTKQYHQHWRGPLCKSMEYPSENWTTIHHTPSYCNMK